MDHGLEYMADMYKACLIFFRDAMLIDAHYTAGRTVSRSVAAGEQIQEKPMMLRAPDSISPNMPGKLEFAG